MMRARHPEKCDSCVPGVGVCLMLLTYAITLSHEFSGDMFYYLKCARDGTHLFHPHHLLYLSNLRLFVRNLPLNPFTAAALSSIVWSAVGLCSLSVLARRVTGSTVLVVLAPLMLGVQRLYWAYANRPEVYVPSAACVLLGFTLAPRPACDDRWLVRWFTAGAALAAACLLNQAAMLAAPGFVAMGVAHRSKRALRDAVLAIALAGSICLAAYVAVHRMQGEGSLMAWMTRYAHAREKSGWGDPAHISLQGLRTAGSSLAAALILDWRRPWAERVVMAALAVAASLAPVVSRRTRNGLAPVAWGLFTWSLVDFIFHMWWIPHEHEQFILCSVAVGSLAAVGLLSTVEAIAGAIARSVLGSAMVVPIVLLMVGANWRTSIRGLMQPPVSHEARVAAIAQGTARGHRYVLPGDWEAGYRFEVGDDSLVVSGYRVFEAFDEVEGWLGRGSVLHVHDAWINVPYGYRDLLERDPGFAARYWRTLCGCSGAPEAACRVGVRVWTIGDIPVGITFERNDSLPPVTLAAAVGEIVDSCRRARLRHDAARAFLSHVVGGAS